MKVEWIAESDTKSWVRYLPPRWIWDGVAVCAVPTEVNRAMLWGWHAHNGVTLGNDRLGFVATSLTTDGGAGLVGYYVEEDRPLAPEERLRFSPGETPPGPGRRPADGHAGTPIGWPRSSATTPWTTCDRCCPSCAPCSAPPTRRQVGRLAGRQIGMQYHDVVVELLDMAGAPLGDVLVRLATAMGEDAVTGRRRRCVHGVRGRWRLAAGRPAPGVASRGSRPAPPGCPAWTSPSRRTTSIGRRRGIAGHVRRTPVIEHDGRWLKLELLQHAGSFKPRGAFNRLLSEREAGTIPAAGVITASGGNHGAAVAFATSRLGIAAEVMIPSTSPVLKRELIARHGALVTVVEGYYDDAQAAAEVRQAATGALMIHPFDHPATVAGQGTMGREIEQPAGRHRHACSSPAAGAGSRPARPPGSRTACAS